MGNGKTKKQAKNVIRSKTFAKKKVKVGKVLKKTNLTSTDFKTKSVVLLEQFNSDTAEPVSHRGLTVHDLNRQIGHPAFVTRRDAVIGLKQLLLDNPELIESNLHEIVSSVARLITDEKFAVDSKATAHVKALLRTVFKTSERLMVSSFELLSTHLRIGFTHTKLPIRKFALEITLMVFDSYPKLCYADNNLHESFLQLMKSAKRPTSRELISEAIRKFRAVYESSQQTETSQTFQSFKSMESRLWLIEKFQFPLFYGGSSTQKNRSDTSFLDSLLI
ncbi:hypothetical protein M3Y98_00925900 [Aphelenchoides besseyi]|nr:hypothetical protein M3Y98_00925900 [Aphelenchoides besseyi]KAI6194188.1 hypothetical protein M3Y96_01098200 [Aphelenchoides besseyi]